MDEKEREIWDLLVGELEPVVLNVRPPSSTIPIPSYAFAALHATWQFSQPSIRSLSIMQAMK